MVKEVIEDFKKENGVDLNKDAMALQRIFEAVEKCKIELSSGTTSEINLPYITANENGPIHLIRKVTRAEFERLIEPLVDKTIEICKSALKKANVVAGDLDDILIVGGSSRIPLVQEKLEKLFGKKPNKSLDADTSIATGACRHALELTGGGDGILLLDCLPITIGIEVHGGQFAKMVEANTTIPTKKSQIFSTSVDNQSSIHVTAYQGERPMAKDNKLLGDFSMDILGNAPKGIPQIEITFDVDANGILTVIAEEKASGKKENMTISGSTNLSDEEIEKMKADAEANATKDAEAVEKANVMNDIESLSFQLEKAKEEMKDKLSEDEVNIASEIIESLNESLKSEDIENMKSTLAESNEKWGKITERLYAEQSTTETPKDDGTTETEFEEV